MVDCFQGKIGAPGFSGPPGPHVSQCPTEGLHEVGKRCTLHSYTCVQGKLGPRGIKGVLGVKGPPVSSNY